MPPREEGEDELANFIEEKIGETRDNYLEPVDYNASQTKIVSSYESYGTI